MVLYHANINILCPLTYSFKYSCHLPLNYFPDSIRAATEYYPKDIRAKMCIPIQKSQAGNNVNEEFIQRKTLRELIESRRRRRFYGIIQSILLFVLKFRVDVSSFLNILKARDSKIGVLWNGIRKICIFRPNFHSTETLVIIRMCWNQNESSIYVVFYISHYYFPYRAVIGFLWLLFWFCSLVIIAT